MNTTSVASKFHEVCWAVHQEGRASNTTSPAECSTSRKFFDNSGVRFFESGNSDALADAVCEVLGNQKMRQQMVERASEHAARNDWVTAKVEYLTLVDGLCAEK